MSDKPYTHLLDADRLIHSAVLPASKPDGYPQEGTLLTIEFVCGFEKFNTRPYHNYETWGYGYRVTGRGVTVEYEDLDDAIEEWAKRATEGASDG